MRYNLAMKGHILLREARRRAGLSQEELGSRAGTTQSAIARVESGRSAPTLEHLTKLLRACGFELQVRLVPYDALEWTLAELNRLLDVSQRLENMLAVARLQGAAHPAGKERDAG
jgi:transcriptional regulator with XRE-family HTH domain